MWCHFVLTFSPWLPLAIQKMVRSFWPAYFLPDVVILKKLKPGWDDKFDNEQAIYKRLQPLQGRVIPIYYGEAQCEGTRALVLSEVQGVLAREQIPPRLDWDIFTDRIGAAYRELAQLGVCYDDERLDNVFLVGDKVVLWI